MIHKKLKKAETNRNIQKIVPVVKVDTFEKELTKILIEYNNELKNITNLYNLESNKKDNNICNEHNFSVSEIKKLVLNYNFNKDIYLCDLGLGLGKTIFLFAYAIEKLFKVNVIVDGIEINPEYVDIFITHLKPIWDKHGLEINVIKKSFGRHSLKNYDFIYIYKPYSDDKKNEEFYKKINKKKNKDTILLIK